MEWIPITEQPLPKDGKNILVTVRRQKAVYTSSIIWISWDLSEDDEEAWYYDDPCDECIKVSEEEISLITAWMYYPEPYEG